MALSSPLSLPCGLQLSNRLAKSAMSENMSPNQNPDKNLLKLYGEWSGGGWGLILTGNVQVDAAHLGSPDDVALPSPKEYPNQFPSWKNWASTIQSEGSPAIVQLSHPGRQSPIASGSRGLFGKTVAPSPIALDFGPSLLARSIRSLVFGTPRELCYEEVGTIIDQFVRAGKLCHEAGFKGVELHGAHGYLIDQFLSPKSNIRTDDFGGNATKRAEFVLRIIRGIRSATSPSFCIGVKINSSSQQGEAYIEECLEQVGLLVQAGIDFLEVSGGSFEDPQMFRSDGPPSSIQAAKASSVAREAFFLAFAKTIRARFRNVPLMVTGGFRSRAGMAAALASGDCDIIGIGRPATVLPKLPNDTILNEKLTDNDATVWLDKIEPGWIARNIPVKIVGAGAEGVYYGKQMARMGAGEKPEFQRVAL